jgi:hypothetical protein
MMTAITNDHAANPHAARIPRTNVATHIQIEPTNYIQNAISCDGSTEKSMSGYFRRSRARMTIAIGIVGKKLATNHAGLKCSIVSLRLDRPLLGPSIDRPWRP